MPALRPFWVSWYAPHDGTGWTLRSPWWYSGYRSRADDDVDTICCGAVMAEDEPGAQAVIRAAHDRPVPNLEFQFTEERPAEWSPYTERFRKADWMQWPVVLS